MEILKSCRRKIFTDQENVFGLIEPAYRRMVDILSGYGINHASVMTGKGYHLVTQVPYIGEEGIALDLTPNLIRNVNNGVIGVLGALCVKPQVRQNIYGHEAISNLESASGVIPDSSDGLREIFEEANPKLLEPQHLNYDGEFILVSFMI